MTHRPISPSGKPRNSPALGPEPSKRPSSRRSCPPSPLPCTTTANRPVTFPAAPSSSSMPSRPLRLTRLPVAHKKKIWQRLAGMEWPHLGNIEFSPYTVLHLEDVPAELVAATDRYLRDREVFIHSDPDILGGTPVIRGTRITVYSVLGRLDGGETIDDLVEDYPISIPGHSRPPRFTPGATPSGAAPPAGRGKPRPDARPPSQCGSSWTSAFRRPSPARSTGKASILQFIRVTSAASANPITPFFDAVWMKTLSLSQPMRAISVLSSHPKPSTRASSSFPASTAESRKRCFSWPSAIC